MFGFLCSIYCYKIPFLPCAFITHDDNLCAFLFWTCGNREIIFFLKLKDEAA